MLQVPRIIGRVLKCKIDENNPVVWDITVEPACDLNKLADVTVIVVKTKD